MLILNLVIVTGGLSISLYALNITAGGAKMNEDQLAQLSQWVNSYFVLVWILAGVALGAIVCWILELILVSRKQKTNKDTTTTISSARLKTIHKEIKEYRSAKNELDDFFKDIQEDKPKE